MWHQVEFLLEGYVLPMTIDELIVSNRFLLEAVSSKNNATKSEYVIAYVAIEDKSNFFKPAMDEIEFFILIYALIAGQFVTSRTGAGIELHDLGSLGKKRVAFGDFEKLHLIQTVKDHFLTKPIFETKELFLKLLAKRQKIMDSHIGLALIYYYFAVQASQKRFEHSIINLMIALEGLLIKEGDKIRGCISNRVANLIAEEAKERTLISKRMKELYTLRSHIVHGRGKKPSFNDTRQLFKYSRKAIQKAISIGTLSKEELIKNLN